MSSSNPSLNRFRDHLGRQCRLFGRSWRLVDLLAAEGRLVLESREAEPPIQPDQYGNATHRAPEHLELPLLSADGDLTEEARALLGHLDAEPAGAR